MIPGQKKMIKIRVAGEPDPIDAEAWTTSVEGVSACRDPKLYDTWILVHERSGCSIVATDGPEIAQAAAERLKGHDWMVSAQDLRSSSSLGLLALKVSLEFGNGTDGREADDTSDVM